MIYKPVQLTEADC